jgi:hypothetical protein
MRCRATMHYARVSLPPRVARRSGRREDIALATVRRRGPLGLRALKCADRKPDQKREARRNAEGARPVAVLKVVAKC